MKIFYHTLKLIFFNILFKYLTKYWGCQQKKPGFQKKFLLKIEDRVK